MVYVLGTGFEGRAEVNRFVKEYKKQDKVVEKRLERERRMSGGAGRGGAGQGGFRLGAGTGAQGIGSASSTTSKKRSVDEMRSVSLAKRLLDVVVSSH